MTYAIQRKNGDVLYFDAITSIEENYTATVTKHPLARGALISDHTIVDNIRFTLKAILSDADFNLNRPNIEGQSAPDPRLIETQNQEGVTEYELAALREHQRKQFQNNTPNRVPVQIVNNAPKWRSFLPEVISQFTANTIPTVIVTPQTKIKSANSVRFDLLQMLEDKEPFVLVEYDNNLISRSWINVIFTGISFTEDADSGEGLFPIMQMEQVSYTNVENVEIRLRAVPNKGRKTGETTKTESKPGDDAAKEPTANSKKSASARLSDTAGASQ